MDQPESPAPDSIATLTAAVEAAEGQDDPAALSLALGRLGRALLAEGSALPALARFQQAYKIARELDDPVAQAQHLGNQGVALSQIGNFSLATRAFRQAQSIARQANLDHLVYDALVHLAELELARKYPEGALGSLDEALALARAHNSPARQQRIHFLLGQTHWQLEDTDAAFEHFEAALTLAPDELSQVDCLLQLGALARARHGAAAAAAYYQQALARPAADGPRRLSLLSQLGEAHSTLGDLPAAHANFTEALDLARDQGSRTAEARLLGSLSLVHGEQGDGAQSLELASQAVALARELDDPQLLGEELLFRAMALHDQEDLPAALAACAESIALFERLEASSMLERARDLYERLQE